ncbi:hypothetical protein OC835_006349 [Tilletia horrida]|nr:hypothetical protein OC835_006349 [Tilletia horrida]
MRPSGSNHWEKVASSYNDRLFKKGYSTRKAQNLQGQFNALCKKRSLQVCDPSCPADVKMAKRLQCQIQNDNAVEVTEGDEYDVLGSGKGEDGDDEEEEGGGGGGELSGMPRTPAITSKKRPRNPPSSARATMSTSTTTAAAAAVFVPRSGGSGPPRHRRDYDSSPLKPQSKRAKGEAGRISATATTTGAGSGVAGGTADRRLVMALAAAAESLATPPSSASDSPASVSAQQLTQLAFTVSSLGNASTFL